MDIKVSLELLLEAGQKLPMFYHDVVNNGAIEGDSVRISKTLFQQLNRKHFGQWAPGNIVHEVVKPIAKVVGLEDCSGCAERQLRLNLAGTAS